MDLILIPAALGLAAWLVLRLLGEDTSPRKIRNEQRRQLP